MWEGRELEANHATMWCRRAARDALNVGCIICKRHPSKLVSVLMDPHHSLELGGAEQQSNISAWVSRPWHNCFPSGGGKSSAAPLRG